MRKVFMSLLAISFFIILLCGCNDSTKQIQPYFTADCVVTNAQLNFKLQLCSYNKNSVSAILKSKDTLNGLEFEKNNSTLYIRYNDLECIANDDYLPYFSGVDVLFDALLCCKNNTVSYLRSQGDFDVYKAKLEYCDCEIFVDSKSGQIKKISPKLYGVNITFDNIKIYKKDPVA